MRDNSQSRHRVGTQLAEVHIEAKEKKKRKGLLISHSLLPGEDSILRTY